MVTYNLVGAFNRADRAGPTAFEERRYAAVRAQYTSDELSANEPTTI
jgi:hypothetical protein